MVIIYIAVDDTSFLCSSFSRYRLRQRVTVDGPSPVVFPDVLFLHLRSCLLLAFICQGSGSVSDSYFLGDRHITRGIILVHNPVVRTTHVTWVEIELSLKVLVISDQSSSSFCLSSMVPALVFYSKVERGAELQICEDSGLNGQCWSQTQPKCINIYYNA